MGARAGAATRSGHESTLRFKHDVLDHHRAGDLSERFAVEDGQAGTGEPFLIELGGSLGSVTVVSWLEIDVTVANAVHRADPAVGR